MATKPLHKEKTEITKKIREDPCAKINLDPIEQEIAEKAELIRGIAPHSLTPFPHASKAL